MKLNVNLKDPRAKRTRQDLKQAFYELITKRDFEHITIREITEKAGINRATFYSHFRDKYDLLDKTIEERFNTEMFKWIKLDTKVNESSIHNLLLAVYQWHAQFRPRCINRAFTFTAHIEAKVKQELYKIIFSWLQNTELPHLRDRIEIISTMMSWSIYGIAQQWTNEEKTKEVESLVDHTVPLLLSTLRPQSHE